MNLHRAYIWPLLACCLLTGCEKIEIDDPENNSGDAEQIIPTSLGMGSQLSPYTVEQVMNGEVESGERWFVGYVVGSTHTTMKNALFTPQTTYTSNILISMDSTCQTTDDCIPVELKSAVQKQLALPYNAENFQQCVMLRGQMLQYFRTNGIRQVDQGYYLPHFDISLLRSAAPAEWQERHERY